MKHHLVNEIDQKIQCIYCNSEAPLHEWRSEFESELHYKVFACRCGKSTRVRVKFHGSGHDNWSGEAPQELAYIKTKGNIVELENLVSQVKAKEKKAA